ncbi:MAG: helix-turn-helix domain-containing protein [Ruminococcaceae bacterium]|nr:helix-turn-helix domain-containing protein [Oscillospiraceae bacterium]
MSDHFFKKQTKLFLHSDREPIRFVHRRSFDNPAGFNLHLNDCIEIYAFVDGEADYIIEDRYFSLSRGDLLTISPHAVHVPVLKKTCVYERFYLLIPLSFFSFFIPDPLQIFLSDADAKPPLVDADKEKALAILYALSALCDKEADEGQRLSALGLVLQLIGLITDQTKRSLAAPLQEPSGVPPLLRKILQYISLSPGEINAIGDIAEKFNISPPYLSALFKKYVGVTAGSYLRIKKIALAKQLLAKGHSVAFTCYECGFSDSSHFIKIFKQYTGMTPHTYKSLHIKRSPEL